MARIMSPMSLLLKATALVLVGAQEWNSACETSSCSGDGCCPSGYYWLYETDCDDWFTGLFADNRIQTCAECSTCGDGEYLLSCGGGSSGSCFTCGQGHAKSGVNKVTRCDACAAGTYSPGGWAVCQDCATGTFQPYLAMGSCYTCEDGQSSNLGATSCFDCGTGTSALAGDGSCTTCIPGSFAASEKQSSCDPCAPGYFAENAGMSFCNPCQSGDYSEGGASACTECPRGYFNDQSASSSCSACDEGYFAENLGSTTCTACSAGTFSNGAGSSVCNPCESGYYIPSLAQTTCLPCQPGTHSPTQAASSCIDCEAGSFAESAASSCTVCAMGSYNAFARQSSCTQCPAGFYGNLSLGATSNDTCSACPIGRASPDAGAAGFDSCVACVAGRYADVDGTTECLQCPAGRYSSLVGATSLQDCIECAVGTFSNVSAANSSQTCGDCPQGTWGEILGATVCEDCEAGRYSSTFAATSNSTCLACAVGRFSPFPAAPGIASCLQCLAGRWNDEVAQSECQPCWAGTWSGAVGAASSSTCQNCSVGRYSDVAGGSEEASCLLCAPGTWSDVEGITECMNCQAGTWSNASGAFEEPCQNCLPGRFSSIVGQSTDEDCSPCAAGSWSFEGLSACIACAAGRWSDTTSANSSSTCTACGLGRFSTTLGATSSITCGACAVKTFSNESGSSACEDCDPGQASQEGSSECSDCGPGFFSGPSSCDQCPVARYSDTKQAFCSQCEAGYVVNTLRTGCVPCAQGFFSDEPGAEDCQECGLGRYGVKEGGVSIADACEGCPAGRVSGVTLLTSADGCESCAPGSFSGSSGLSSCQPCPAGEYQEASGQSVCTACAAGRFLPDTGSSLASACEDCPPGRTAVAGSSECTDCPAGTHSANFGQSSCDICTYANETGSIGCCPGNAESWPVDQGFMLSLPPGKSATEIHVLSSCEETVNPTAPELEDFVLGRQRRFSANPLSLATIRPAGIHSCVDLECGENNTCSYVEPESALFWPGSRLEVYAEVQRRLPAGGLGSYRCPQRVSVSFAGFGCQQGALLSFGLAHLCVIFITLLIAVLVELFLRRHIDVFLEVALDVSSPDLQTLPSTTELHKNVLDTLKLKTNELPPTRFQAWQTSKDSKANKVQMEFQVSAVAGADMATRDGWFAKANAHSLCGRQEDQYAHVEELYKEVELLEWKAEGPWSKADGLAVRRQPLAVVKEVGRLPGADLVDSLESITAQVFGFCCRCISRRLPRLNEETEVLRLRAARAVLQALMTRKIGIVLIAHAVYTLLCVFGLPLVALQIMTCAGGYPYEVHFAWLISWLVGNTLCNVIVFCEASKFDRTAVKEYVLRFQLPLLLRFFFVFVSVTDLYQDATFPVISYSCGFDLWFVSTWLVILGVVIMQICLQIVLVHQCYRKFKKARTPEEKERYHVEGLFLALRALDNHVLVYAARPSVEERLGGSSCWKMKTVESRIAFSRFIFEDAEQCALQGIFLVWFESASLSDKIWIGLSTATSLSLSFTLAVQTFAEVRDWVWHRMLAVLTWNGIWISRWVALMIMVVFYRAVSAYPWFGSCAPAQEGDAHYLSRYFLPWQFEVPSHVREEIFSTSAAAVIATAVVTLLIILLYRRELGVVSVRRHHTKKYNFQERLEPPELRLKSEQDEDDWLPALRKLHASSSSLKKKLESLDEKVYHLARGKSGASKAHFGTLSQRVHDELDQIAGQLDADDVNYKELRRVVEANLKRLECRTKALALLADRKFRKKGLTAKARAIQDATGAQLRLLPAEKLSSLRELPQLQESTTSPEHLVADLQALQALEATGGRQLILVYVSHTGEDNQAPGKVQGLVEFTRWFQARAREQDMKVELFFWIDYCCLLPTEAFAAIPLFIATCTEILVWRTPLFDRRVWPLTERLLAYCFCKGGLTPYALDASSFVGDEREMHGDPAEGEDDEKIAAIWAGSTGKTAPEARKVAPAPQLLMLRRQRRLINPLQESLLDTAGLQRRIAQLVDMASSVSALEIFADRQPVDFGLTAVVELWLGSNETLPAKVTQGPRLAWSSDASIQWLSATRMGDKDRLAKASYDWRLKVEVKSDADASVDAENPNADMDFYSDEWIPVILPHDTDASTPSPDAIAELFQQVDKVIRKKKIGRQVDLAILEKAAAALGMALCADLARAMETDTVEAIEGALKRSHGAQLPKSPAAQRRLCELQLGRALASGDEGDLTMALREASRVGGDMAADFEGFNLVKQKLANQRAMRLQQQSLEVIRGDGKDLESVMAVISVALRRSDWDREWDQIWLEVLQEGRAKVKSMVDEAKVQGDHGKVARIFRLAEKHGLRVIAAHCVAVWEDTIQSRQDVKTLVALCSAAGAEGAACQQFLADAEEAVMKRAAELEASWDKSGAPAAQQAFDELFKELNRAAKASGGVANRLLDQVKEYRSRASSREEGLKNEVEQGLNQKVKTLAKNKDLDPDSVQEVMRLLNDCQQWSWQKFSHKSETILDKQAKRWIQADGLRNATPKLLDMKKAAEAHQVSELLGPILEENLKMQLKSLGETAAIQLLHLAHAAEQLKVSDVRVKAIEEMKREIERMKNQGPDGMTELRAFQDEAQDMKDATAAALATESLAIIEERERKKKEDLLQLLQAQEAADILNADPEKTVQCLVTAEESGWQAEKDRAAALLEKRLSEAQSVAKKEASDEAIVGFRFLARALTEADRLKCSVGPTIRTALTELSGEKASRGPKKASDAVQLLRAAAWCKDVPELQKSAEQSLESWLVKWRKGPEARPNDAEQAEKEAKHLEMADFLKVVEELRALDDAHQRAVAAPSDAGLVLAAWEAAKTRSKSLQNQVEKMIQRALEEAKQSGDETQLIHLRDRAPTKKAKDEATKLLNLMAQLPQFLTRDDWEGVCGLAAGAQKEGYSALGKQARQHLRDRVDQLLTKTDSEEPMLNLYTAAKKTGLDEFAELLVQKLGAALPASWAGVKGTSLSVRKETISDEAVKQKMQEMVDKTFRTWGGVKKTRDRGKTLVDSIKVEEVIHVENADNYLRYSMRREKIRKELQKKPATGTELDDSNPIKTKEVSLKGLVFHPEEPTDESIQEVWLWHGTSEAGASGITDTDFDMGRAGSAAGTMFGRGLYFAESCMKSDEYTQADGRNLYPLILCRVTCGRLFYCDWKEPFNHKDELEDACHNKGFHCILGDREKVRKTYREFIVFDNDQVYPEYIVWYSR